MENEIRKVTECDGLGCETACCYGCACCVKKSEVIKDLESKMEGLNQKVLELMTRQTSIGSAVGLSEKNERLEQDNQRLRKARDGFYLENQQLRKMVGELERRVGSLKEKVRRLKKENEDLVEKVKVIGCSAVTEVR